MYTSEWHRLERGADEGQPTETGQGSNPRASRIMLIFLLNGIVFLLIGLEIAALVREMHRSTLIALVGVGLVVSVALIAVRALWITGIAAWQRFVAQRGPTLRPAEIVVLSWSGLRGVVSLAAALALPLTLPSGAPLPARAAVIVITFTVILVTLVGQGMSLSFVIRGVRLGGDEGARAEEQRARRELVEEALRRIGALYEQWPGHRPLLDQLRATYGHRLEHVEQLDHAPGSATTMCSGPSSVSSTWRRRAWRRRGLKPNASHGKRAPRSLIDLRGRSMRPVTRR